MTQERDAALSQFQELVLSAEPQSSLLWEKFRLTRLLHHSRAFDPLPYKDSELLLSLVPAKGDPHDIFFEEKLNLLLQQPLSTYLEIS